MVRTAYGRLMASGQGNLFDRHAFACALAAGLTERPRPMTGALGLSGSALSLVVNGIFPAARDWLLPLIDDEPVADEAMEEADLRQLLLDHRSRGVETEEWLAAIVARRSLAPHHLWQDLGLFNRAELSRLMGRYFRPLAIRNTRDMKWKKFFYRELCQRDGIVACRAPTCDACSDLHHCFGGELGEPLIALQQAAGAVGNATKPTARPTPAMSR
jgi:nitrogen fixation protein NifQ